jgi:hypothetical protein
VKLQNSVHLQHHEYVILDHVYQWAVPLT